MTTAGGAGLEEQRTPDAPASATADQVRALAERVQDANLPLQERKDAKEAMETAIAKLAAETASSGDTGLLAGVSELVVQARQALADATDHAVDKLGEAAHGVLDPAAQALADAEAAAEALALKVAIGLALVVTVPLVGVFFLGRAGARAGYAAAPTVAKYGPAVATLVPELTPVVAMAGLATAHRNAKAGVETPPNDVAALIAQLRGGAGPGSGPITTASPVPDAVVMHRLAEQLGRVLGEGRSRSVEALAAITGPASRTGSSTMLSAGAGLR